MPLFFVFVLLSCAEKGEVPEWVYDFKPQKGEVCGVGVAGVHMRGFAYQRATAIVRAIDEISRQKGVTVDTRLEYFMAGTTESGARSGLAVYSVQTSKGQTIRARVVRAYYDKDSQMFYVLMCEER